MEPSTRRWTRGVAGALTAGALVAAAGVASAQDGGSSATPAADSFRSIVHVVGLVTAAVLAGYAYRARQQFQGGVFARSATFTAVGAAMFVVAFALVELQHGFGVVVFSFLDTQARLAIRMGMFATTVFAFGWAAFLIADTLQEWELA